MHMKIKEKNIFATIILLATIITPISAIEVDPTKVGVKNGYEFMFMVIDRSSDRFINKTPILAHILKRE